MHDGENKWIDRAMATGVIPLWFMGGKFADINDTVPTGRGPPLDAISKIGSGSTPASIVSTRSKRSQSRDDCSVKTALPRYFASFSPRPRALQRRGGSWKHGRVFPLLPFCVLPPIRNRINRRIYWTRRDSCQPSYSTPTSRQYLDIHARIANYRFYRVQILLVVARR